MQKYFCTHISSHVFGPPSPFLSTYISFTLSFKYVTQLSACRTVHGLYFTVEKARARGEEVKRCWCCERQRGEA